MHQGPQVGPQELGDLVMWELSESAERLHQRPDSHHVTYIHQA